MTSDQQRQFEHMWPALSARLHRLFSRKRVSPWLAEDLVQETGLRLIKTWPQIDQTKPIWPLTATIALNLFRDEMRRAGSNDSTEAPPDAASAENVEDRGLARVQLRAVGGALAQMPASQRDAILADLSPAPGGPPLASSARMLRMRARRRLQHLMDHASVLGVALGIQMRRVVRELELLIGKVLPIDAERATTAAISVLAAISLGVAIAPPSEGQAGHDPGSLGRAPVLGSGAAAEAGSSSNTSRVDAVETASGRHRLVRGAGQRSGSGKSLGARGGAGATAPTDEGDATFPDATRYTLEVTDDTYARGELQLEVVGGDGPAGGRSLGSLNCTVAPSQTGASCTTSEGSSQDRGVRARHHGEAWIAGQRVL